MSYGFTCSFYDDHLKCLRYLEDKYYIKYSLGVIHTWSCGKYLVQILPAFTLTSSRIHERTISLRFLGIILRVLRLEVSVHCLHSKPLSKHFSSRGRGVKSVVEVIVHSKEENSQDFCFNYVPESSLCMHRHTLHSSDCSVEHCNSPKSSVLAKGYADTAE